MKHFYLLSLVFFLAATGCSDSPVADTTKDTYHDDIADICFLNGHFFTTNYDLSGNSGSQIDLIRFDGSGKYPDDAFDLSMNGQGYLAMTTDSTDIYLQSRNIGAIFKYSVIGERAYTRFDTLEPDEWQSGGICYLPLKDSLMMLYRNLNRRTEFRARTVSVEYPRQSGSDTRFSLAFIDTTTYGIWAMTWKDGVYYMLGADTLIQDKIIRLNANFSLLSVENVPDSTVVGLTFKGDDLYLSYRDRRIEFWRKY